MLTTVLIGYCATVAKAAQFALQNSFSGPTFLDQFDFWSSWDPTFGFVQYVDRTEAESLGMLNTSGNAVKFGAEANEVLDPFGNLGRKSIRLTSKQTWTHGLFILDLAHMPSSTCGIWPAFWMLGNGPLLWPTYGEIDVIEFTNDAEANLIALHTSPNCTVAGSGQTSTLLTNDCGADEGYKGCNVSPTLPNSAGTDFNANGGGIYAVQWDAIAIRVWFFPRTSIPINVLAPNPDPSTWGLPTANYEGSCNIDSYFFNASLVFNIDFCGTFAGPTFNTNTSCPVLNATNQWSSCNTYVAENPQAFSEAYWEVNYLNIFQTSAEIPTPTSSSLSSVTPAESTTSVSASGAEGRSTTSTSSSTPPFVATSFAPTPSNLSSSRSGVDLPSSSSLSVSLSAPSASSAASIAASPTTTPAPVVVVTTETILVTATVTVTVAMSELREEHNLRRRQ